MLTKNDKTDESYLEINNRSKTIDKCTLTTFFQIRINQLFYVLYSGPRNEWFEMKQVLLKISSTRQKIGIHMVENSKTIEKW